MKKIISVLLCIVLLFSFGITSISATETIKKPLLLVEGQVQHDYDVDITGVALKIRVFNTSNPEKCTFTLTINEPPFADTNEIVTNNCKVEIEKISDGVYTVQLIDFTEDAEDYFAFLFFYALDTEARLNISVKDVELYDNNGLIEDVDVKTGTISFIEATTKYDLTGDSQVTAEDARQALRFAVGLDVATDAQCRVAGVDTTNDFTADMARTILRKAVGLDA